MGAPLVRGDPCCPNPETVPDEELADAITEAGQVIAQAESVRARLWARLLRPSPRPTLNDADELLTVAEASALTKKKEWWFYEHADELDCTRRVGRSIRVSKRGLLAYLERDQV